MHGRIVRSAPCLSGEMGKYILEPKAAARAASGDNRTVNWHFQRNSRRRPADGPVASSTSEGRWFEPSCAHQGQRLYRSTRAAEKLQGVTLYFRPRHVKLVAKPYVRGRASRARATRSIRSRRQAAPARRQVVAQAPLAGGEHHPACSRSAGALVSGQARERDQRPPRRAPSCQDRAVLESGLAGALSEVREHRMRSVAQDGDPAACPLPGSGRGRRAPTCTRCPQRRRGEARTASAGVALEFVAATLHDPRTR